MDGLGEALENLLSGLGLHSVGELLENLLGGGGDDDD